MIGENPTKYKRTRPKLMATSAGQRVVRLADPTPGDAIAVEVDINLRSQFSTLAIQERDPSYLKASGARKGITGKSGEKPARSRHCE
jgi:hypothetical protein